MKKIYKADNITCQGCANTIKSVLEDDFGKIEVNLEANPKEVTLEIPNEEVEKQFKEEMKSLGYPVMDE